MLKKYPVIKWSLAALLSVVLLVVAFGVWFMSMVPSGAERGQLETTMPADLPYIFRNKNPVRGKILAVVTSQAEMGHSGKKTGYELTELARPYYVFKANGFEVDVASPRGGIPPAVIDKDDMGSFDYAFLNDSTAQRKVNHTIAIAEVRPEEYKGVYFVGGKGAMYDFPEDASIQQIVQTYDDEGKIIGAVCHGPAALVNVVQKNGDLYLAGKKVCGFTNEEELFLIPEAASLFPFLLQSKLVAQGGSFEEGHRYLNNVIQDGNLITGQNPWSTWSVAEAMVRQLGYSPVERKHTAEENTIDILSAYADSGYLEAKSGIRTALAQKKPIDRTLLAMHCIVSAMEYDMGGTFDKLRLLAYAKRLSAREGTSRPED